MTTPREYMNYHDHEILLGYSERYVASILLPTLASKRRRELLELEENPFTLALARASLSGRISAPAVLGHLGSMAQAALIERTQGGYRYTEHVKLASELMRKFASELECFRDSRSSYRKWETLTRLHGRKTALDHKTLSIHTDLPESTLTRLISEFLKRGLIRATNRGKRKLYEMTGSGHQFVDKILDVIYAVADYKVKRVIEAGPGTYDFMTEPGVSRSLLEYDGESITLVEPQFRVL